MSERQKQILALAADGLTNAEIAAVLYLSEETVKSHMRKALRALAARNRAHAVGLALRNGVIA